MNETQRQNARRHYDTIRARMESDGYGDFYVDGATLFALLQWLDVIADGADAPSPEPQERDR